MMGEEKSWSQRSLEEAHQRKIDFEYGQRTGVVYNDATARGAATREEERKRNYIDPMWQMPAAGASSFPSSPARPRRTSPKTLKDKAGTLAFAAGVLFFLYALVQDPAWSYWQIGTGTLIAMLAGALAAVVVHAIALFVRHVLLPLLGVVFLAVLISHFLGFDLIGKVAGLLS